MIKIYEKDYKSIVSFLAILAVQGTYNILQITATAYLLQ